MVKSSVDTRKTDERKVMDALGVYGKGNIKELAKTCGFSVQKVVRIIKNLEKKKIIWGYSAITWLEDKQKHFTLLVKRSVVPIDDSLRKTIAIEKLDDYIQGVAKIENIYITHGYYDWVITFYASNLVDAKRAVDLGIQLFDKYIKEYLLLETLFPIRKQEHKNPQIEKLVDYL